MSIVEGISLLCFMAPTSKLTLNSIVEVIESSMYVPYGSLNMHSTSLRTMSRTGKLSLGRNDIDYEDAMVDEIFCNEHSA